MFALPASQPHPASRYGPRSLPAGLSMVEAPALCQERGALENIDTLGQTASKVLSGDAMSRGHAQSSSSPRSCSIQGECHPVANSSRIWLNPANSPTD